MNGQNIETYYPFGQINPIEIDEYGGEYENKIIEIIGVVSSESQAAFSGKDEYDAHTFKLKGWKTENELFANDVIIFRPVEKNRSIFEEIPKYSIVKLSLYFNKKRNRAVMTRGQIIKTNDMDLIFIRNKLKKPIVYKTLKYGNFDLNKDISIFEGKINWNNKEIELIIDVESIDSITDELDTIENLVQNQKEWSKRIDNYILKELLPLKNEYWLDEGENKWNTDKFLNTYKLESIWISKNGNFQFWHNDGDIFWGHSILIEGNIDEGPNRADIPG